MPKNSNIEFSQDESYEWVGSFWFPEDQENKFSGKITYTPEQGVKIRLTQPDAEFKGFRHDPIAKKYMHGVAMGDKAQYLTLTDVYLTESTTYGNIRLTVLDGSGGGIIIGDHFTEADVKGLEFHYDEGFMNLFSNGFQKERLTHEFSSQKPAKLISGLEYNLSWRTMGVPFDSVNELDTIFHSTDPNHLEEIKKVLEPLVNHGPPYLTKNYEWLTTIQLKQDKPLPLADLLKVEWKSRFFWETLLDHTILVKSAWVLTDYTFNNNETHLRSYPFLNTFYKPKPQPGYLRSIHMLPINFFDFKNADDYLAAISSPLDKWIEIMTEQAWQPVNHGLRRVYEAGHEMIDSSQFVSLVSEVETLLNLTSHKDTNLDCLIKNFGTEDWDKGVRKHLGSFDEEETVGEWISQIRNVITHPKSGKKANGKYLKVVNDPFELQNVYSYTAGLFIKAVLSYLDIAEKDKLDTFMMKHIEMRACFKPITFV